MSYILDALRKSDQQRSRGTAPTLFSAQEAAAARKRPGFLVYGLLAAVLIGAGIVIGGLRPWEQQKETARAPIVVAPAVRESAPPQPKSQDTAPVVTPAPVPETTQLTRTEPKPLARVKRKAESPPREATAAATAKTPPPAEPEAQAESAPAETAELPPVIVMAELPPSIRGELPQLKFTVHAYAGKPASRIVGIDNRILREGDTVAPGLKLEEITPDGMILSYKGYRFSRGVN
jgi:general secretion pathway protein B